MAVVERFTSQIFVGSVATGHRGARQHIFPPPVQSRMLVLRRAQRGFDGGHDRPDAQPVGFSVPIGGTCPKILISQAGSKIVVCAGPQEKLKNRYMSGPKPRAAVATPFKSLPLS